MRSVVVVIARVVVAAVLMAVVLTVAGAVAVVLRMRYGEIIERKTCRSWV